MNMMISRTRRENPKVTERIERDLILMKQARQRAQLMGSLIDHPGWEAVKATIKAKLDSVNVLLDRFRETPEREVFALLQERVDLQMVISMVEDFDANIQEFDAAIEQKEVDLGERSGTEASH